MKGMAAALDDAAIKNLAAFYAAQQPQAPKVRKPLSLAELTERCDRCHGVNGNSIDPLVPAIAAQRADWLEQVLNAYHTGARKSTGDGGDDLGAEREPRSRSSPPTIRARPRARSRSSRCPANSLRKRPRNRP